MSADESKGLPGVAPFGWRGGLLAFGRLSFDAASDPGRRLFFAVFKELQSLLCPASSAAIR